jgi:hypothetical protein
MAVAYLGALMVATLIAMIAGVLWWGAMSRPSAAEEPKRRARPRAPGAGLLMAGVAASFGLYVGYKNRPGAYRAAPAS